jgi:membrane dipeptidase
MRRTTERSRRLLARSIVWDNHGCMPLRPVDSRFLPQLERYRRAGFDVVGINVGFDAVPWTNTIAMLGHFRRWIAAHPRRYALVGTVADIERARRTGKLGVFFDIEGGASLDGRLSMVELYYDLGVRWMLIAYNRNNLLGGGCQDDDRGLTRFGRQVLAEMNRLGMVPCCSHTGYRTTLEVMRRSEKPVIFSHSNPLGVWRHKRNVRDEAIRACAATGGVVGINGIGIFLGRNDNSSATLVEHIDYVAQLVGADHVGLGLDYVFDASELDDFLRQNPAMFPPEEGYSAGIRMVAPEQLGEIIELLLAKGYAPADVARILGGNFLRVARESWGGTRARTKSARAA